MLAILQSLRVLATHFNRPLPIKLSPPRFIPPSFARTLAPKPWALIPRPTSQPSALFNLPALPSAFQTIQPIRAPYIASNAPHPSAFESELDEEALQTRISRWSTEVATALTPVYSPIVSQTAPMTDMAMHDLVASRFVLPVLRSDDV
ncbi:hypothetical protein CROQUDRAFT_95185 [Cronartium quercuum f. sp. fusiforme G11]|uniref:Uncharacterized protein n=1 Tax=Cronartium quercuum f. sp. fusiforme G11 TaxID=708437 RepID=A0A9P6T9N1_9BASI|nr:hypothetical protein CROQUDRAFT_95185 [Cronartium quercuum f. sp. fusiforme G11]